MSELEKTGKPGTQDDFESQIKAAEAKLETLKAQAVAAGQNAVAKAIDELLAKKQEIMKRLGELKQAGGEQWEKAKADFAARITEIEKSVNQHESKVS